MSKNVQGKKIYLSVYDDEVPEGGGTAANAYKPLACLTSNSLSESQEVIKSDPNKCSDAATYSYGEYSYEASAEGQFLDPTDPTATGKASYDWLHDFNKKKRTSKKNIFWRETTVPADGTATYRYGEGIITALELAAPADGDATFTMTIQGIGEISHTDPKAPVTP
ncbi:hypothetical protein CMV04_12225 [Elizabethkingia anophelis]|nr:hypothetical protein [Elizabethkingia anophelis]MDV3749078.1 hypothetical protein [Elizabethkingia anophelis]